VYGGGGEGEGEEEGAAQRWLDGVFERFFPSSSSSSSSGAESSSFSDRSASEGRRVRVGFERVVSQDVFYRRCFVRVGFEGVRELAGVARACAVIGEGVEVGEGGEVVFGRDTEKW
jgi:2',3'-cyclic-nucleotide 3'-phosphodiesterase